MERINFLKETMQDQIKDLNNSEIKVTTTDVIASAIAYTYNDVVEYNKTTEKCCIQLHTLWKKLKQMLKNRLF